MSKVVAWFAGGVLVLGTSVYGMGTLSASVPKWLIVYGAAGVFSLALVGKYRRRLAPLDAAVFSLLAYMGLSLSWSWDWMEGLYQLVNASALAIVFLWVRHTKWEHVSLLPGFACLALAVSFIAQLKFPEDMGGHGNRNFQTEIMLSLIALSIAVRNNGARHAVIFCSVPVLAYLLIENESKIEWAVGVGLILFWALRRSGKAWSRVWKSGSTRFWLGWPRRYLARG